MGLGKKALKQDCMIPSMPVITVFATGQTEMPGMRTSFQGNMIVCKV